MTGWVVGWIIGAVVVALVVTLLLLMIRGASRAVTKAGNILIALESGRDHTAALWQVDQTNKTIRRITNAATAARLHLESKSGAAKSGAR
jgi:Na+-transporting methylmalonyl-CoA/oxaloacetate decarboxylase gamma subunit